MKKWLIAVLIVVLISLQIRLWVGDGSIAHVVSLQREIEKQKAENEMLRARNSKLAAEVEALKNGGEGIEARARRDMGFIKKGETFFMVIEEEDEKKKSQ